MPAPGRRTEPRLTILPVGPQARQVHPGCGHVTAQPGTRQRVRVQYGPPPRGSGFQVHQVVGCRARAACVVQVAGSHVHAGSRPCPRLDGEVALLVAPGSRAPGRPARQGGFAAPGGRGVYGSGRCSPRDDDCRIVSDDRLRLPRRPSDTLPGRLLTLGTAPAVNRFSRDWYDPMSPRRRTVLASHLLERVTS